MELVNGIRLDALGRVSFRGGPPCPIMDNAVGTQAISFGRPEFKIIGFLILEV